MTPECAYCSDDMAFMKSCQLVESSLLLTERLTNFFYSQIPIYLRTYDENSITNANPCKKIIASLANNSYYVVKKAHENNVPQHLIAIFVTDIMMGIFENYVACAKESPDLLEYNFNITKEFYNRLFKTYEKVNGNILQQMFHGRLKKLMSLTSDHYPTINLDNFINSLKDE